jgi:hypothetical protein
MRVVEHPDVLRLVEIQVEDLMVGAHHPVIQAVAVAPSIPPAVLQVPARHHFGDVVLGALCQVKLRGLPSAARTAATGRPYRCAISCPRLMAKPAF